MLAAATYLIICCWRRRKIRYWVRPSLHARKRYSGIGLINDLESDNCDLLSRELRTDGNFKNFVKLASQEFEFFIVKIGLRMARKDTPFRDAIPFKDRLGVS